MKKGILIVISAIILLTLTGCGQLKAEYAIGKDNKVTAGYSLQVKKSDFTGKENDLDEGLAGIQKYWEEQGMTVAKEQDGESVALTGKMEIQTGSAKEAFEKLKQILTGAYSPFKNLDFRFSESYLYNQYSLSGEISLADIIRREEEQAVPDKIVAEIKDKAGAAVYSVTIALPGSAKSGNSENTTEKDAVTSGTWTVQYGQEKLVEIATQAENTANKQSYDALTAQKSTYELYFFLGLGAGAALLITIIILLIVRIKRHGFRRTSIQA